jgi:hypothetical protein
LKVDDLLLEFTVNRNIEAGRKGAETKPENLIPVAGPEANFRNVGFYFPAL